MKKAMLLSIVALLFAVTTVSADNSSSCEILYGGGQVCPPGVSILLDKKVQKPTKGGEFVDNLTVNDSKFAPNQSVVYQVVVKNTGNSILRDIEVTDILPTNIIFVSGPGSYDSATKKLTVKINSLEAGNEFKFNIIAKTATENSLPANEGVTCIINEARAETNGIVSTDTAQLCVEKQIVSTPKGGPQVFKTVPMKQTPPTGPEAAIAAILPLTGLLGIYLRKKTSLQTRSDSLT